VRYFNTIASEGQDTATHGVLGDYCYWTVRCAGTPTVQQRFTLMPH
jgi:hypothetical protein